MEKMYIAMMIIGISFPLISMVFHLFDACVDFIQVNVLDVTIGDFDIDFLPISMNSLCMASLLFGGISLCLPDMNILPRHIIAGLAAYVGAVLTQTVIRFLKTHQAEAEDVSLILVCKCVVCNTVPANGYGSIVAKLEGHSDISMPAKSVDGSVLEQGTMVMVDHIENNVAYIRKNLEESYK